MKKNEFLVEEYVAPCVEVVEVVVERGFAETGPGPGEGGGGGDEGVD